MKYSMYLLFWCPIFSTVFFSESKVSDKFLLSLKKKEILFLINDKALRANVELLSCLSEVLYTLQK